MYNKLTRKDQKDMKKGKFTEEQIAFALMYFSIENSPIFQLKTTPLNLKKIISINP